MAEETLRIRYKVTYRADWAKDGLNYNLFYAQSKQEAIDKWYEYNEGLPKSYIRKIEVRGEYTMIGDWEEATE